MIYNLWDVRERTFFFVFYLDESTSIEHIDRQIVNRHTLHRTTNNASFLRHARRVDLFTYIKNIYSCLGVRPTDSRDGRRGCSTYSSLRTSRPWYRWSRKRWCDQAIFPAPLLSMYAFYMETPAVFLCCVCCVHNDEKKQPLLLVLAISATLVVCPGLRVSPRCISNIPSWRYYWGEILIHMVSKAFRSSKIHAAVQTFTLSAVVYRDSSVQ